MQMTDNDTKRPYQLPGYGMVLSHFETRFSLRPTLLRDGADESAGAAAEDTDADMPAELLMRARISSGDYFITLATELDRLAQGLAAADAPEAPALERIVPELLYLDSHYVIRKNR